MELRGSCRENGFFVNTAKLDPMPGICAGREAVQERMLPTNSVRSFIQR